MIPLILFLTPLIEDKIFVTEKNSLQIRKDQKECMGCLSQCKFSNWSDNEENKYSTGRKVDPRSFCIQKTLQNIAHGKDPDKELMFAGHNAWKFKNGNFSKRSRRGEQPPLEPRRGRGDR